jgi:hypothetical protein
MDDMQFDEYWRLQEYTLPALTCLLLNRVSRFLWKFVAYLYNRKSSYPRIVTKVRMCILLRNTEIYNEINYNTNALFHLFILPLSFIKRNSYCCTFWSLSCNFWHRICRTLDRMHYGVVRDIGHRLYKAVLYFRNTWGSSKHENVISLTPKRKVRPSLRRFSRNSHWIALCSELLHQISPKWINYSNLFTNSFTILKWYGFHISDFHENSYQREDVYRYCFYQILSTSG